MNHAAKQLLDRILSSSQPEAMVCLPLTQARQLAELGARELGESLKQSIARTSPSEALEVHGLFSRRIRVVKNQTDFTVDC